MWCMSTMKIVKNKRNKILYEIETTFHRRNSINSWLDLSIFFSTLLPIFQNIVIIKTLNFCTSTITALLKTLIVRKTVHQLTLIIKYVGNKFIIRLIYPLIGSTICITYIESITFPVFFTIIIFSYHFDYVIFPPINIFFIHHHFSNIICLLMLN